MEGLSPVENFSTRIALYSLCSKKDLIAIAFVSGWVSCHRLNWSIACTPLRHKSLETKIVSLEWRPDGRYLAIGFENGTVKIYNIENGTLTATLACTNAPRLHWNSFLNKGVNSFTKSKNVYLHFKNTV